MMLFLGHIKDGFLDTHHDIQQLKISLDSIDSNNFEEVAKTARTNTRHFLETNLKSYQDLHLHEIFYYNDLLSLKKVFDSSSLNYDLMFARLLIRIPKHPCKMPS
jgi:hypothetical protein